LMYACSKAIANGWVGLYFMTAQTKYLRSKSKDAIFAVVVILGEGVDISGFSLLSSSLSFEGLGLSSLSIGILGLSSSELSLDGLFLLNEQTDE
jgi:hypothetical protein